MVAKAGLGLIGLSAISVGGVALAKPHLLGMDYMPEWHSLSEDNNFTTEHSDATKFGKKYGKYLVGVTQKGESATQTNKAWWDWAYRRLSKDKDNSKSKKFKKEEHIAGGFITTGENAGKSLHKVCEEAYKKGDGEFHTGTEENTGNKFTKDEIWKYCSPGKLTTTSEGANTDSYVDTQIGGNNDNKTKLISVKNSANDWFWEIRNKDFWSTDTNNELSGQKATADTSFKTTYDADKNKAIAERKTIKELCGKAYALEKSSKPNEDTDAKKFCKLEA